MQPKSLKMALMKKDYFNDVSLEIFEQDFITILGGMVLGNQLSLTLLQEPCH